MDVAKQYDEIAEKYTATEEMLLKKYSILPTFFKMCGDLKDLKVLDLACGSGVPTRGIKREGASKVVGFDISPEQIRLAKKEDKFGVEYFVGDAGSEDFKVDFKADLVTAIFLLNYAKDKEEIRQMAKNIFDILKPGGKFLTINSRAKDKPRKDPTYGVVCIEPSKEEEGGVRTVIYFKEGVECYRFDTYYWKDSTYDKTFQELGFKKMKVVPGIASEEAIREYGEEFWEEYLKDADYQGLIFEKEE